MGLGLKTSYNGKRLKSPGSPDVYLIDQGMRRKIPNPTTMNNLFADWSSIVETTDTDTIIVGPELEDGAVLFSDENQKFDDGWRYTYLIDGLKKRRIVSKAAFTKYNFNDKAIQSYPSLLVESIPDGDVIA